MVFRVDFDHIVKRLENLEINLYDYSLYQNRQIFSHRFQAVNRCNDIYSVTKAFVITAVGLLWDDGKLDPDRMIALYFKEEFEHYHPDPAWRMVTVEQVMRHRIGFDEDFLDIDYDDPWKYPSDDFLKLVFEHPIKNVPGSSRQYSDAAAYLLSRLVEKIAGEPLDNLLQRRIMAPLHVREAAWSRCPFNHPIGATGLYMSAHDMVKLGALYLDEGCYDGRRLLSREWVRTVIGNEYEFHAVTPNGMYAKEGMMGQGIVFCEEKGFAAAWHSYEENRTVSHQVLELMREIAME